jgi:hypothetical protein
MASQTIGEVFRLVSGAQRDSRSGTAYVVVAAMVRGEHRVFVRDRATHGAVRGPSDVVLAVAERGRVDFTGLDAGAPADVVAGVRS